MSEVPEFPTLIQNRASLTTYLSQSHPRHSSSKSRPLLRILCRRSLCRTVRRQEIRAIWKLDVQNYSKSDYHWILRFFEFAIIPSTEQDVSENSGFYPQIIHLNRVFHYFHQPFWGTPFFGNTQQCLLIKSVEPSRRRAMSDKL